MPSAKDPSIRDPTSGMKRLIDGSAGGLDGITSEGYPVGYGTSYLLAVVFDECGPVAHSILVYGQSGNPDSPHAGDQLQRLVDRHWLRLPFLGADVKAAELAPVTRLRRDDAGASYLAQPERRKLALPQTLRLRDAIGP